MSAALWGLAACVVAWMVWSGFAGPNRRLDARPLVLAGHAWLHGQSPYSPETYSRLWGEAFHVDRPEAFVFAYPPSAALVLVPLALGGVDEGLLWLDLLNLGSLALALCVYLADEGARDPEWRGPRRAAALTLAAACGALSGALLVGQSSLWALAALLWLWRSGNAAVPRAADVFALAVAAAKPSLTLPLLCFLALFRPRLVGWGAALSLAVCVAVAAATDGAALLGEWLRAVAAYAGTRANAPAELASAQYLVARLAPELPAWPIALLGGVAGCLVGWSARGVDDTRSVDEHWLAAVALAAACSPAHAYDLVLGAPLAALSLRVRRAALPWYALGIAAVSRPAAIARFGAALAGREAAGIEQLVSALGTLLLAGGVLAHVLLHRPLLGETSRSLR